MVEIVAFPTEVARPADDAFDDQIVGDRFLLDEGLELLADYRAITDPELRSSLRALMKSMARRCGRDPH